jgi:hypothetical protein
VKAALAALACWLAAGALAAQRPDETRVERDTVAGVTSAIEHKNCPLAVARLNEGLAAKLLSAYMVAGTMYEEGLCLKPSWDRALQMYLQADQRGHEGAWVRLVAGYAYQRRDPASAIWWLSRRGGLGLPAECRLPSGLWDDPEAIVATLRAWPAGQVEQCVYSAGVVAFVAGDFEYPQVAIDFALNGKVAMHFVPATGSIDWKTLELEELQPPGVIDGDRFRDRSSRKVRQAFETYLRELGERALRRFERPTGIDPDWQVEHQFQFNIDYR